MRGHLTKTDSMTPGALIDAARMDLKRRKRNCERRRDPAHNHAGPQVEHYAFLARDVRHASTAYDVLRNALATAVSGEPIVTKKIGTALLYRDPDLIERAMRRMEMDV